jgi:hypothetical protein
MGNHASANQPVAAHAPAEPLEAFSKEKQRDDHLKNLGFKRSKSIRKSIAKRLKRKKKHTSSDDLRDVGTGKASEGSLEARVELERPKPDQTDKPIVGLPQLLPAHVQVRLPSCRLCESVSVLI